jgi:GNAT superfamily N-acetyltransferase
MSGDVRIRRAQPGDAEALVEVERDAGRLFRGLPGYEAVADGEPTAVDVHRALASAGTAWVAEAAAGPVGFLAAEPWEESLHIAELSVRRDHQRKGIARALIAEAAAEARRLGLGALTLTTFAEIPWNAPFYARLGFVPAEGDAAGERLMRALEADRGRHSQPRIAMRLPL